jgi:toxin ParE1/3/4
MAGNRPTVLKLRPAVLDIVDIADYIAADANLAAADRFIAAVEKTCEQLARMPGIGSRWEDEDPELTDVRFSPVTKFKKYLIYYRPIEGGIEILRVIHGARNTRRLLGAVDNE